MKIRLALLLHLLVSRRPTAPSFAAGDRFALVIGNAKYPDAEAPLKEPINDARDVADELKRDGFTVDIGENLTGDGMRRAFDQLYGKIKPGSVALIFFSGFGVQSGRQSYMIPVDAQIWTEADVRRDGFSLETVLGEINSRGAGVKIALIDASRRNPFERRFRSFSAGPCAGHRAERHAGDVFGGAVVGGLGQWRRSQPVRAGTAQGNPRPRPDGRGNAEPHPGRRHPRLAQRAGAVDFVLAGRGFLVHSGRRRIRGRRRPPPRRRRSPPPPPLRRAATAAAAAATAAAAAIRTTDPAPAPPQVEAAAAAATAGRDRRFRRRRRRSKPARRRSRWPTIRPSRA